jgi:hypothetical protein
MCISHLFHGGSLKSQNVAVLCVTFLNIDVFLTTSTNSYLSLTFLPYKPFPTVFARNVLYRRSLNQMPMETPGLCSLYTSLVGLPCRYYGSGPSFATLCNTSHFLYTSPNLPVSQPVTCNQSYVLPLAHSGHGN